MNRAWQTVEENLRWADILDVCLVAMFVYFILSWLLARTTRGVLVGVLVVGFCYFLSHWLDLYLTRLLFQAGFVFLLLSIVVVLQQDIRRGFEKLAAFKWARKRKAEGPHREVVRAVLRSVAQMSIEKTGALIVFPGREPLERFTHGGIHVDAYVSPTLLHSIFNPRSPGHDGAVIIRRKRVEHLGVHLPLSTNVQALGAGGTRHAAALGLAERCDALVIVVSEERGSISVAHQDQMRTVTVEELESFLVQHEPATDARPIQPLQTRLLRRHLPLKLASMTVAVALWSIFAFRVESVQRNYVVPVEFRNVPDSLVVERPSANYVRLVVSGTERVLDRMNSSSLVVTFDLAQSRPNQFLRLQAWDGIHHLPNNLNVIDIDPPQITLEVKPVGQSSAAELKPVQADS